jgi:hypothetical protein
MCGEVRDLQNISGASQSPRHANWTAVGWRMLLGLWSQVGAQPRDA